MRQSKLFTRTCKETPKDETSFNAQTLMRAGFIDKMAAGIYTFLPLGLRVHNKICNIIRQEMDAIGGQEILMPALTPKEVWQTTDRWDNFDALFKLTGGDDKEYALGATHEEIVTPTVAKQVMSYKDLSISVYQIQTKFRNEKRAKAGLLRGREFSMKDMYSFHPDDEALNEYYKIAQKAYFKVYQRLGLIDITYLTYAAGGAFSKYSHEYQTLCESGEDTIHICDKCKIAINEEIINEVKGCPNCQNEELRTEKAIEVGNIFKLGTRFSEPFKFTFKDQEGNEKPVIMGCYGMGPSRLMGTIVEVSHDERGIIWPEEIAPYRVYLINFNQEEKTNKVYEELKLAGVEVLYNDTEVGAGQKMADADLFGCPFRVIISEKSLVAGGAEVKRRNEAESKIIKLKDLTDYLKK